MVFSANKNNEVFTTDEKIVFCGKYIVYDFKNTLSYSENSLKIFLLSF